MIAKIQLRKNATVLASDGRQLGSLGRVVLNPDSNIVTNIVVRTGNLLKHTEKVVPIGFIAETADSLILLREEVEDLDVFPPFEEKRLVDEHGDIRNPPSSSSQSTPPTIAGYPIMGTPIMSIPDQPIVTHIEQNIPEGTVAMKEGAKVISADGEHVGVVDRVLADPVEEQVTYLGVSKGLFVKDTRLIPMKWVLKVGEEEVHLRVSRDSVENMNDLPIAV